MNRLRRLAGRHSDQPSEESTTAEAESAPAGPDARDDAGSQPQEIATVEETDVAPADVPDVEAPASAEDAPPAPPPESGQVDEAAGIAALDEAQAPPDETLSPVGETPPPAEGTPAVEESGTPGDQAPTAEEASTVEGPAVAEPKAVEGALAQPEDDESLPAGEEPEVAVAEGVRPRGKTAPLPPEVESEELSSLPSNAVVDSRYVVQSLLHHGPDRNLYRVTARRQQRCPACGRLNSTDASSCLYCGAALAEQQAADFYLMAEGFRPEALIQDPGVMALNLYHPNLVPVVDFFEYKPFGQTRYYAVAEPRQGVRLSQLSLPRPGLQVVNWAIQLADVLEYLHNQRVVGAGAEADDILVQGETAALASLQNAHVAEPGEEEATHLRSVDLARLAGTIYEAYTGYPAAMSPEGVLPMPSQAPGPVGQAFRAAIEPVQGSAPAISAGEWRNLLVAARDAVAELERPGRPVGFVSAGLTDVGRVREQNQDSFCMAEFVQVSVEHPARIGLYVIADGMGGHKGGETASSLAAQAFSSEVMGRVVSPEINTDSDRAGLTNEAILQGMSRAVQAASDRIYRARDASRNDMGTTLVAALIAAGKAYIVNVGDSRMYMYARPNGAAESGPRSGTAPLVKGTSPLAGTAPLKAPEPSPQEPEEEAEQVDRSGYSLRQISVDHSLVYRLVELGQLDPEEAKVHPHRNFIYRSLGGPPPVEVDTFVRTLNPGDRLLLCSDGLNSMIEDSDIERVLADESDPQLACQRLIDLASEAGGHDNITVIVVDISEYLPADERT